MRVDSKVRLVRSTSRTALIGFATLYFSGLALGKYNNDEDEAAAKAAWTPNIYLDLQTTYATIPANTLAIGLGSPSLLASFPTLATLSNFTNLPLPPTLPTPSSPATQSIGVDVPLTVDISDRISIWGGYSGTTSRTDMSDWSNFAISGWFVGFQAQRLSTEWRIDPDDHAAVDRHEVGAGFARLPGRLSTQLLNSIMP